jgi:UPF0288 family protein (methanogenesis marker protein 3)
LQLLVDIELDALSLQELEHFFALLKQGQTRMHSKIMARLSATQVQLLPIKE